MTKRVVVITPADLVVRVYRCTVNSLRGKLLSSLNFLLFRPEQMMIIFNICYFPAPQSVAKKSECIILEEDRASIRLALCNRVPWKVNTFARKDQHICVQKLRGSFDVPDKC